VSEHRCLSCEDWKRRDAVNKAEIARLREAIKRTAKRHESTLEVAVTQSGINCTCEICRIAREGR
jgi:hypothetical protein